MNPSFSEEILALGRQARASRDATDVRSVKRLKTATTLAELIGRILLHLPTGPFGWFAGMMSLAFHLAVEAQINHSVTHGAYTGLKGAEHFQPGTYETLALPLQSRTWRDAHRIHHSNPSLLGLDPDTLHPFFRVHKDQPWRPWHLGNLFPGGLLVFEMWGRDYDRYLKDTGRRPESDRGELRKLLLYVCYQYILFPLLAGPNWGRVLVGGLVAELIRNFIFVALQTGSSVGSVVSTVHPRAFGKKSRDAWFAFQVETSKNFKVLPFTSLICGGLDRHVEHHLFPSLPPERLRALAPRIRELCLRHGVDYQEHASVWASLADSITYLARLSLPH